MRTLGNVIGWLLIVAFCLAAFAGAGRAVLAIGWVIGPWIIGFLVLKAIYNFFTKDLPEEEVEEESNRTKM